MTWFDRPVRPEWQGLTDHQLREHYRTHKLGRVPKPWQEETAAERVIAPANPPADPVRPHEDELP